MKQTPLHSMHIAAGAKMGEFAGFDMPLFYPLGVMKEHQHTREAAGLFDISHMVHVELSGPEAGVLVERLCPYLASQQEIGEAKYTFFLNEQGGIIDDLIVTRLGEARWLIVANAGCAEKDVGHINQQKVGFDVSVAIIPRVFLALQGPMAESVLSDKGLDVANMGFMSGKEINGNWFVSRTGYTGEDGFEIGLPESEGVAFAQSLLDEERVELIGLGARDSLRLEAGLSLYGQDLSEEITPLEAGLTWAIPKGLRDGGAYIGAGVLARKIDEGRTRMRVGLLPDGRPVRGGTVVVDGQGTPVGTVTSGGFGPSLGGPMALALVDVAAADEDVFADMRGKQVAMKRTKLPFVPHNYKR